MNEWRIGTTQGGLNFGSFVCLDIPKPSTLLPKEYQEQQRYSLGKFGVAGYTSFTIGWNSMTPKAYSVLRHFIDTVRLTNHVLYLHMPTSFGSIASPGWKDIRGYTSNLTNSGRTSPNASGMLITNVEFQIMNVEIL